MNIATACGLFVAVAGGGRATWKEADADALSAPGSVRQPMGSNA